MSEVWPEEMVRARLINPFYAIEIDPRLCVEHSPLVERAAWIRANARAIEEMGAEEWLNLLLHVLETGGDSVSGERAERSDPGGTEQLSRQQRRAKGRRLAKQNPQT